jgi:hypothetical protein
MRLPYIATLDWSPNPADISTCISVIYLFFYHLPSIFMTTYHMPIDLSNLSAEDVATATTAVEAARRAREAREHWEAEDQQRRQEEEQVHQAVTGGRMEGSGGTESGSRAEGVLGSRQDGVGSGGGGRAAAITRNGALRPQTHHPYTC